jgi:3-oxoacyl-[acyl-carrier protein] reductase
VSQAASRAVVVGSASGIGWAVAKGLAAEGRHVTIADRNAEGATEKTRELGAPNGGAHLKRYSDVLAHVDRMASA